MANHPDTHSGNWFSFGLTLSKVRRPLLWAGCIVLIYTPALVNGPAMKSPPASTPAHAKPVDAIAREMVDAHNAIRSKMNLPPLQWSTKLAAFSQNWAKTLVAKNRSAHNPNSPYGENIFVSGIGSTPEEVVHEWASESRNYTYRTNNCSSDCGHYTQIIWRSSQKLGCAVARGKQREVWVCSYDPPGNYTNEWPY